MTADGSPSEPLLSKPMFSTDTSEEVIKLNVGGQTYCIKSSTVKSRSSDTKLYKFVLAPHPTRIELCDAYFVTSQEYYFERSPKLFDTIYKYYLTGSLHRPFDVCQHEFFAELHFWRIPQVEISECCLPRANQLRPSVFEVRNQSFESGNLEAKNSDSLDDLSGCRKDDLENDTLKNRIYKFTEGDGTCGSAVFTSFSICFVLISVLGLILGSIHEFQIPISKKGNVSKRLDPNDKNINSPDVIWEPHWIFNYLETTCIIWFTIEYLLRFCVAPRKLSFVFEILNMVDLIAIVPFYLEMGLFVFGFDSSSLADIKGAFLVVRILRVLRVVRILKLGRYSSGMRTFALTLRSSARQLGMMGAVLCTGVVFFSTLIYYVEKDEVGTPFSSIPAAFWFVLVTMTTVGYGDSVPVTIPGKLIASGAIVSGVLVLALPITIIVDNFMKVSGNHQSNMFGGGGMPNPSSTVQLDSLPASPKPNSNNNHLSAA
uniref:BTB domain-containing protein n=1 Tax=Panagrolaimus sp. JU765 TaxID=591449 RepID=A0AC34Q271_9BILA